ncbi:MAG TPA: site-specific DNA-methyltransferase [Clostridiales bacterium]|nr:site-specific DNA-methyltransferase [Clostridiales bacterium]
MNETKLNGQSVDIASENVQKLKEIFPEVFCEDKIDFAKLQAILGEYTDDDDERYNFTWWGKSQALRLAQTPSMGTLRPCKEESKNWDTTQNLYIEGDNLEVLKLLQKSYHSKVKMIYIDPPYNTGGDFVYPDNYRDPIQNYFEMTSQVDKEGKKISTNSETSGRYHTNWLNMMFPRLRLARNLLRDDGLLFLSIDDNEISNLRKLCDEVFGEENLVGQVVWQKRTSPDARKKFSTGHEYIVIYIKKRSAENEAIKLLELSESDKKNFSNPDNDPRGPWVSSDFTAQGYRPNQMYKIVTPGGAEYTPAEGRCWKNVESVYLRQVAEGRMWFGLDGKGVPRRKTYLAERSGKNSWTWWPNKEVGHTQEGTQELKRVFGREAPMFDFPKPTRLIKRAMQIGSEINNEDIILDFFSGSATTAHAMMQLNAEDDGNRKFILVQLPEPLLPDSDAAKVGYSNISEIGKERIRRAGEKIKAELQAEQTNQPSMLEKNKSLHLDDLDIGFKVFKLDTSNLKKWNPDIENLEESLLDAIENYVEGRSELDVVYEIMLKYGIDLTLPLEEFEVSGKKIYSVGYGALMICLDREITTDVANEIVRLKEKFKPEVMRVVFKDNGFKDDSVKTNTKEILRNVGIDEIVSI